MYLDGHKSSEFMVGDRVKIKDIGDFKQNSLLYQSWGNCWVDDMDKYIGKIGTIERDSNERGFIIDFNNSESVTNLIINNNDIKFLFPYFALEKVEDEKDILSAWASLISTDLRLLEREKRGYIKKEPKNEIIQYIRDNKRNKIGVMAAFRHNEEVYIGWSLCSKQDVFDREFGIELAKNRAVKLFDYEYISDKFPYSILGDLEMFIDRCVRYFKDGVYPAWII